MRKDPPQQRSFSYFGGCAENMAENLKDCRVPCKMSWDELEALCRRERLHCKQLGVNRANVNDYEVEFLCDYKKTKEEEFYMVKWKGFPESDNTWEPKRNLKCPKLMKQFHLDLDQELRRHKRRCTPKKLDKEVASFLVQKAKFRQSLQRWEVHLNQTRNHPGRIFVMNEVDFEGPPKNFTYINNYKVGQGIVLDEMAVGCECKNCLEEPVNGCCPGASLHRMAYNDRGQVRIRAGQPIYECNSQCSCGADCPNRVVQKGIQFDLCIFKTENGRGWGVRTLQHIKKNTFVMEYVGECNPNLQVFNVFIDNIDERLPRIALFSTRAIRAGEELTFDYKMQIDPVDTESTKMDSSFSFSLAGLPSSPKKRIRVECRCGSDSCRKYLF
ncbi:histone-lysine N-methyltransferase SUV39H1-like isoform X6 [Siniperca chuatsi]|uniref:histone-lysine N-methyltransferase SUV39H1-like isoform X6 n=1 Tax=Siniperca chuatsi TaxID=119488 RepID=UPI001CE1A2A7|nr:histone-lysine N-methyltransferase SUV39H1-like isoform X6 [Siniperca chuatsi]